MKTAVGICFRNLLQVLFLLLAAVFLFAVDGWASCYFTKNVVNSSYPCQGPGEVRPNYVQTVNQQCSDAQGPSGVLNVNCGANNWVLEDCPICYEYLGDAYISYTCCGSKCEADSLRCVRAGKLWDSPNCNCSDICQGLEEKCIRAGGTFTGRALNLGSGKACCSAICDQCNTEANEKILELKRKYCCDAGFAPPAEGDNCYSPPGISGCGITILQRMTSTLDYLCRDPNSSEEAANAYYDQCFPGSSSSGEGGGSSSSGEGGGSSSGGSNYPEGCDECPWLDSILDTLTLLKWNSDDMLQCIVNPSVCTTSPDEQGTQVDSVILEGVKEKLDSVVARLRSNDTGLRRLDTSLLKLLDSLGKSIRQDSLKRRLDSAMAVAGLKNDTMIRNAIADAGASVDGNLVKLRNTTDTNLVKLRNITDTNLVKLRDGVFELDTGMKHHLDSIIAHLPDTILDSIRKYQDSTLDRIDTALFGAGVGFSLVDSMIDTVVKYFRVSNHYDSVYNQMFASFDSTFKYKMENLEMSIESDYSALGYGDTASSTLRKDLSDMKEAITSAISDIDGSVTGSLDGLKDAIDGLGGGSTISSFDSAIAANGGGTVDTSGVYLDIYGGELLADSIARDVGYDKIDVARDTAAMDSVLVLDYTETDSTLCVGSECVSYDSDAKIADSAQRYIARQGDSVRASNQAFYKDSVDSYFQQIKDTLTRWNPFGMFDSTLMKTLGAKVPNSNTCPEHCSKYRVDVPFLFGNLGIDLDWQLCASWAVLGNQNVMSFLRFIIRVIVAVTCISMVMHAAANTKLK